MEGLQDLWDTIQNTLTFGVLEGIEAADVPRTLAAFFINLASGFSGLGLVFVIIYGGYMYLTSAGDPQKTERAQKTITNGIIGTVLVIFAWTIANFILYLFGAGGVFVSGTPELKCGPGEQICEIGGERVCRRYCPE